MDLLLNSDGLSEVDVRNNDVASSSFLSRTNHFPSHTLYSPSTMLSRSALRTASVLRSASASTAPRFAAPMGARTVTNLSKHVYTAHARAEGAGRNGLTSLVGEGGGLEVKLG